MFTNTTNIEMEGTDRRAFLDKCKQTSSLLKELRFKASQKPSTAIRTDVYTRLAEVNTIITELRSSPLAKDNIEQVQKVGRDLKATHIIISNFDARLNSDLRATAERQCRIVDPEATDDQIEAAKEEAVAYPDIPIFAQPVSNFRQGK
jgi:hypothetical protein